MPRFSRCWRCGNTGDSVVCKSCAIAKYCSDACERSDKYRHECECKPVAIVKRCSSCTQHRSGLRACLGCYRAYYCDVKCQKSHRKQHKSACNDTKEKIDEMATKMSLVYLWCGVRVMMGRHYYWGNIPAFDGLNLLENEGARYRADLNVLYLGVGDLRNVALTCASLPDTYGQVVTFALNDNDCCTMARLVLFLYMLIMGGAGVEEKVTEIWYSILLSEQTYKHLHESLRALICCVCARDLAKKTAGLITIDNKHLEELKAVWIRWNDLQVKGSTWVREQRQKEFVSDMGSRSGMQSYLNSIPREHVKSATKWMKDGVFQRSQMPAFAENPTLTGHSNFGREPPYTYAVPSDVLPFTGWDYIEVQKFKHAPSLVTMYGAYVEDILKTFARNLSKKKFRFEVLLCNCVDIEQHTNELERKYDRIFTSNLMDYMLLPKLLKLCSGKLNRTNPFATIVTETQNWTRDYCPEADVGSISDLPRCMQLVKIALDDTKNRGQVLDVGAMVNGTGIREYLEISAEFIDFIRALFHAHSVHKDGAARPERPTKVPTVRELGSEFQLQLRNGFRNENRIATFKMAVNRRRVTMMTGLDRVLEWIPLQSQ